jgi:hypothetical protein
LLVSFLWLLQVIAEKCNAFTRHAVPAGHVPALQAVLGGGELLLMVLDAGDGWLG